MLNILLVQESYPLIYYLVHVCGHLNIFKVSKLSFFFYILYLHSNATFRLLLPLNKLQFKFSLKHFQKTTMQGPTKNKVML